MPGQHQTHPQGRPRIRVRNPAKLAALVKEALHFGTDAKGAKAIGWTDRVRYWLLRNGQLKGLEHERWARLQALIRAGLPALRWREIDEVVWSPEETVAFKQYQTWLTKTLRSYRPTTFVAGVPGLVPLYWLCRPRRDLGRRAKRLEHLITELSGVGPGRPDDPKYIDAFANFYEWCKARGHDDLRILLSLVRVLGPLVDAEETDGYMETSWRELHEKGRLERYLKLGFTREKLTLKDPPHPI